MNIDPMQGKHEIVEGLGAFDCPEDLARWIPLTEEQAETLQRMTPKGRAAWIKAHVPTKERLARMLVFKGAKDLAERALQGEFSDFDGPHVLPKVTLVQILRGRGLHEIADLVVAGEYDDTRAEADEWAAKQTGEVADVMRKMIPRRNDPCPCGSGEKFKRCCLAKRRKA